jgi:hypothetical protein
MTSASLSIIPPGREEKMNSEEFRALLAEEEPRNEISAPLAALWWEWAALVEGLLSGAENV